MSSTNLDFIRSVVDGDLEELGRRLAERPALAAMPSPVGRGEEAIVAGRASAPGWRRGPTAAEQDRVDADAPRRENDGAKRQRLGARVQQAGIIQLLQERGARTTDKDGRHKSVQ